jgi:hypothetical protein
MIPPRSKYKCIDGFKGFAQEPDTRLASRWLIMHGNDRLMTIVGAIVLFLVLGTSWVFGGDLGDDEPPVDPYHDYVGDLTAISETISHPSSDTGLAEGSTDSIEIPQGRTIIKNLTATLTWNDETQKPGLPRLRRFENLPDQFSLGIKNAEGNTTQGKGTNTIGAEGRVELTVSIKKDDLNKIISEAIAGGQTSLPAWTANITLESAGDWLPMLPPKVLKYNDVSNAYILEMKVEYYDLSELLPE